MPGVAVEFIVGSSDKGRLRTINRLDQTNPNHAKRTC